MTREEKIDRAAFEILMVTDLLDDLLLEHKGLFQKGFKDRVGNFKSFLERTTEADREHLFDIEGGKYAPIMEDWKEKAIKGLRGNNKK